MYRKGGHAAFFKNATARCSPGTAEFCDIATINYENVLSLAGIPWVEGVSERSGVRSGEVVCGSGRLMLVH